MPVNRNKFRRLFAIHQKLRTMQPCPAAELLTLIADKTGEHISDRTLREDINDLILLGADIPRHAKAYKYQKPFSFLEVFDDTYLGTLNEAIALLRQLAKDKAFIGLEDLLLRLEQRLTLTDTERSPVVQFDEVLLTGRAHLIGLYRATATGGFLRIKYRPFGQPTAKYRHVFPVLLKEFNNRWFLLAWENGRDTVQTLAIDRIETFHETADTFAHPRTFDAGAYFEHTIGVSRTHEPVGIVLRFSPNRKEYVLTKKLHRLQQTEEQADGSLLVRLTVELNRELVARLLEFGSDLEVLEPLTLRQQIRDLLKQAFDQYD